jgi:hypothetical protein
MVLPQDVRRRGLTKVNNQGRLAATYVDKTLTVFKSADLLVERPRKF